MDNFLKCLKIYKKHFLLQLCSCWFGQRYRQPSLSFEAGWNRRCASLCYFLCFLWVRLLSSQETLSVSGSTWRCVAQHTPARPCPCAGAGGNTLLQQQWRKRLYHLTFVIARNTHKTCHFGLIIEHNGKWTVKSYCFKLVLWLKLCNLKAKRNLLLKASKYRIKEILS